MTNILQLPVAGTLPLSGMAVTKSALLYATALCGKAVLGKLYIMKGEGLCFAQCKVPLPAKASSPLSQNIMEIFGWCHTTCVVYIKSSYCPDWLQAANIEELAANPTATTSLPSILVKSAMVGQHYGQRWNLIPRSPENDDGTHTAQNSSCQHTTTVVYSMLSYCSALLRRAAGNEKIENMATFNL